MEHKLKSEVKDNEEAIENGVEFEPIEYEWTCGVFKSRYQEPAGGPVTRLTKPNGLETVIYSELGGVGANAGRCLGLVRGENLKA